MSVVNASRATRLSTQDNSTSEVSEPVITPTTDLSDASAVVADVLNKIVNTVDSGAPADIPKDASVLSEDGAEDYGFAIDTAPTVEKVIVKTENDPKEVGPVLEDSNADTESDMTDTESDAHELKNRFLTAARYV